MNNLISRQSAIDVADYTDYTGLAIEDVKKVTDEVVKGLKRLPSIDAVKHGRWITVDYEEPRRYGCSECHRMVWQLEIFCPNCGADMRKQKLQYGDEDTSQGGLMSAT